MDLSDILRHITEDKDDRKVIKKVELTAEWQAHAKTITDMKRDLFKQLSRAKRQLDIEQQKFWLDVEERLPAILERQGVKGIDITNDMQLDAKNNQILIYDR